MSQCALSCARYPILLHMCAPETVWCRPEPRSNSAPSNYVCGKRAITPPPLHPFPTSSTLPTALFPKRRKSHLILLLEAVVLEVQLVLLLNVFVVLLQLPAFHAG